MKKTGKIIAIIVVLALVVGGVYLFAGGRKNTAYREEIARTQDISTYYTFPATCRQRTAKSSPPPRKQPSKSACSPRATW